MSYLMVRNPGVTDPEALTLLGASGTRYANNPNTVGTFGSGSKYAIALFLRHGINPVIVIDNLKMEFFSKPIMVNGRSLNQIFVKYSGRDHHGRSRTSTVDLNATLEWGISDWTKPAMGFREFVANAIDGATLNGGSYKDVEFEVKDSPRAKAGHTAVFLPLTPEVQTCWNNLGMQFLHFSRPDLLDQVCLPKGEVKDYVLFYKKGVLVGSEKGESVYDYNLGDSLRLDESRNANTWDTRYAVARTIGRVAPKHITEILLKQLEGKTLWEDNLDSAYLYNSSDAEVKTNFTMAFKTIAGDNGVLVKKGSPLTDTVQKKGFKPICISTSWLNALEQYELPSEKKVLDGMELEGNEEFPPTPDMLKALDKVWELIELVGLTNGRTKPPVKGFMPIMNAGSQTWGLYKSDTVYIHQELGNDMLLKVMLEEVVHHCTGSGDMSRDFQDYLIRMIVSMYF